MGSFNNRRCAGVGFQMAPLMAAAFAGILMIIDDDVSTLGAMAMFAHDKQAIDDDPAADPGSQREQNHAPQAAARADPSFAIGGRFGVVRVADRQAGIMGHFFADRKLPPRGKVHRLQQHPRGDIHRAGRSQADSSDVGQLEPGFGNHIAHRLPIRREPSSAPRSTSVGMDKWPASGPGRRPVRF